MNSYLKMFDSETPIPGPLWRTLDNIGRQKTISRLIDANPKWKIILIKSCNENGQVFVECTENLSASRRGNFLLDLELDLKKLVDDAITIWNQPLSDKSSLRRLRGVIIKS